jgi:hypothetical protein
MQFKHYLIILSICCGLLWGAFISVLFLFSPFQSGFVSLLFFYLTLALALLGSFSLIGFVLRSISKKDEIAHKHVNVASRQSVLFTLLIIVALILQAGRWLEWWNLILLVVVTGFFELFFMSLKKK